jgi:hypothetical protein
MTNILSRHVPVFDQSHTDPRMDAAYLKSSVGPVLANALSFVATQQPEDPIECIANYLLKHSSNTVARNNVCSFSSSPASSHASKNQKEQAEIEASKLKEAEEAIVQLKLKQEEERVQAEEAARLAEAQKQVENNTVVTEVCSYLSQPLDLTHAQVEANSAEASDPAINSGRLNCAVVIRLSHCVQVSSRLSRNPRARERARERCRPRRAQKLLRRTRPLMRAAMRRQRRVQLSPPPSPPPRPSRLDGD